MLNIETGQNEEPQLEGGDPGGTDARNPEGPTPEKPKSARKKRLWLAVAAVVLVAGGTAFGTTLPDPKASDAYVGLTREKSAVESARDSAKSSYDSLKSKYDTLQNGIAGREAKVTSRETEVAKAEAAAKAREDAVKQREDAVTAAEKTKAANTVSDGTWTVGKDIEPGTYRAAAAVGSTCYWGIYQSGTNGSQIIQNDIPGGGRPAVNLSAGQDFNSTRCGKWEKQ